MPRTRTGAAADLPFAALAAHLISLRRTARLTQRALAEQASISRGAVQRAESATAAPCPTVLDAYLRACAAAPAEQARARMLRNRGRAAQRARLSLLRAPSPALIHTRDDLSATLAAAYERAGAPALRDLDLPGHAPLPPTTAWRIVNRKSLPATAGQLQTFLTACGITPAEQRLYVHAYHRLTAHRPTGPVPPRAQRTQLAHRRTRRHHPVPLSRGGTDTGALYDIDRLAAGIRPVIEALAADPGIRSTPTVMAAGVQAFAEAFAVMFRSASREAHRNGITAPNVVTATSLISHGIDPARLDALVVTPHSSDDHSIDAITFHDGKPVCLIQSKTRQQPPDTPPALPSAPVPNPPPSAPAAARAA